MVDRDRLVKEFIELVSIDSISGKERLMADRLTQKLTAMGHEVYEDNAADAIGGDAGNLICTIKGTRDVPAVLFSAHMDTVEPGVGKKPVIDGDIIRSDGTTVLGGDDVSGIVCILEAVRALKENGLDHGDIQIVFTIAEEGGLYGSKNLDYSRIHAKYGFIMDSNGPIGTVAVKAPAQDKICVSVEGKASHAGVSPEKGISAIQAAASAIARMKLGRIDFETTANIGSISGGRETNIVCDRVEMKAEARSRELGKLEAQTAHMRECFEQAAAEYGATVDFKADRLYPSFNIARTAPIMSILEKAAGDIGIELIPEETGGGSDTNIFNGKGIQAVDISTGMENVHSTKECISIDNMVKAAEFVIAIIRNIA
ncbi:MAG: M20/M25/M40 family metallo-hydrolase [Clostridiaceae bacterium]|nr:M20/M25/M40 family metallo-hydrolase [Clostridiaceae bacterium]